MTVTVRRLASAHCLAILIWALCSLEASRAENQSYDTRQMCGWTVHVSRHLLQDESDHTMKALDLLEQQLKRINELLPDKQLEKLHEVPLWISPEYAGFGAKAEYHPDAGWLRAHGRDPQMAKSVEFTNVSIFEEETRRMPLFVLHELAHAYHDRVLGNNHQGIREAFETAKKSGKYERVERRDAAGQSSFERSYALTNAQEYFAECTETFFGANDFYPFDRKQLGEHDPIMHALLAKLWDVQP